FITAKHADLVPGKGFDFFPFPSIVPANRGAITVGADVPVMVHDSPAARSFMAYLAGATAQETWIRLGGFTSVNRSVSPAAYPDPVARKVAAALTAATVTRFSAGDMMPSSLQRAWWGSMLRLVRNPGSLDDVLGSLTEAASAA